ncbi:MAG: molybdopterin-dependent oxidoreductase [Deltaproteobacteria bacterium]|jgi:CO/xanthine dehydrogenase Mo-binding subunit|nr:molybdopterin-dependent oxidoreductase [Deltaproteobacteria bacterium]
MSSHKIVGKSLPQIDSWAKVTGEAEFVTDIRLVDMLYGKIFRSDRANALIKKLDISRALKLPGVKSIATHADTPGIFWGPILKDWQILAGDRVRFIGEEIAVVAATSEEIAQEALGLIDIEYEDLPAVFDPEEALSPDAPLVNPHLTDTNVAYRFKMERGDVEGSFAQADYIYENTFRLNRVYQGYIEPNGCTGDVDTQGNGTIYAPSHYPYNQRRLYAEALDLPVSKLNFVKPYVGGSFGAKFERACHPISYVISKKAGKPVKITLSREEDFIASNSRVPMSIAVKIGVKNDGTLLVKQTRIVSNNGARTVSAIPVTSTSCYRVDNFYRFKSVKADGYIMYTNTAPSGSMRGFGNAQMTFALESSLDDIADHLGISPVEMRLKNVVHPGDKTIHGWKIGSCGINDCLEKVTSSANFTQEKAKIKQNSGKTKRGIGLACANHVSGNRGFFGPFDGAAAYVKVTEDGYAQVTHGEADLGQGQNTVFCQMAAEILTIPIERLKVPVSSTNTIPFGLGSFASRGTTICGNAVIAAAENARLKLLEAAAVAIEIPVDQLFLKDAHICSSRDETIKRPIAEVVTDYIYQHCGQNLIGEGFFKPDTEFDPVTKYGNISPAYIFAAHVAEVAVNTDSGEIEIINYHTAHDFGKIINPLTLAGQLHGGLAMGFGWVFSEEMLTKNGEFLNTNFLDYRMPGSCDIPDTTNQYVETHESKGPFGAKGASELMVNPVPAAISNAVFNAIGIRFQEIPITPEKVLAALGKL